MLGILPDWASYEDFHNLTWVVVDLSWNISQAILWWPFILFTVVIAWDLTIIYCRVPDGTLDAAHYVMQLVWLASSIVWNVGDFYFFDENSPIISIFAPTPDCIRNYRFIASVVCCFALLLGIVFHLYWTWATVRRSSVCRT
jgi:hypothetical protein